MIFDNMVDHPTHYTKPGRKECIVEMRERYGSYITAIFCLTNAYKYLYRAGEKAHNPEQQDLDKAKWYFNYAKELTLDGEGLVEAGYVLYRDIKREIERCG